MWSLFPFFQINNLIYLLYIELYNTMYILLVITCFVHVCITEDTSALAWQWSLSTMAQKWMCYWIISWIKGEVTNAEELNSKSAVVVVLVGSHSPSQAGRANKSLSRSLTDCPVTAGINSLPIVDSRDWKQSEIFGNVCKNMSTYQQDHEWKHSRPHEAEPLHSHLTFSHRTPNSRPSH